MFSDDQSPGNSSGVTVNKRAALLVAVALVAAVLGFAGAGSGVAQTNVDAVTFSGTITAEGGASTDSVLVTVGAWCWDSCGIEALPDNQSERPRPVGPVEYLGQTSVDSSGSWSVTVSGVQAEHVRSVLVVVWDTNGQLASRFIDSEARYELWQWESLSEIDVELEAGGRVSGSFSDSTGGPPPLGSYALTAHQVWPPFTVSLDVDPQTGAFTSTVVAPGEYRLAHGDHSGGYLANNDAARVNITAGQTANVGTVQVQQSGQITGIVTDSAGRALNGIAVSGRVTSQNPYWSMPYSPFNATGSSSFWATTGDDGTYTAQDLVPGWDWQIEFEIPTPQETTAITTGQQHSCEIRADSTIACWGNNRWGEADAPDGQYTTTAAGDLHTCAIRDDATIACWGNNWDGKTNAPGGTYTAIAAGRFHSCAIKTDGSIACWGNNWDGQTDAPRGQYTAVAAGGHHTCAIKTDGSIACWGNNWEGQTDAPGGQYTAVAAGQAHSCAIRTDSTIACWGNNQDGQTTPSQSFGIDSSYPEDFLQRFRSRLDRCWVSIDGWVFDVTPGDSGYEYRGQRPLAELCGRDATSEFNRQGLSLPPRDNLEGICRDCSPYSRRTSRGLGPGTYDENPEQGVTEPPDGRFTAISASRYHSCAIRDDLSIACWGNNRDGETDAPDGQYSAVAAGGYHSCAIPEGQASVCWGLGNFLKPDSSGGQDVTPYTTVSREDIAVASGGTVTCNAGWPEAAPEATVTCDDGPTEGPVTFSGTITAPVGASTANVVVTVAARCSLECESTSAGLPDDGSERARPIDPVAFLGETVVDSTGRWSVTVPGSEEGPPLLVVWDRGTYLAARYFDGDTLRSLPPSWRSASNINIELAAGGRVSGQFANPSGGKLPSGEYALAQNDGPGGFYLSLHPDLQTGRFTSPAVAPGQYRLAYGNLGGDYFASNDTARVQVTASQTTDTGSVELKRPGRISGKYTDSTGAGIPNARVLGTATAQNIYSDPSYLTMPSSPFDLGTSTPATTFEATTGDDGTYTSEDIAPGNSWRVQFEDPTGTHPPQNYADAHANTAVAIAAGLNHSCAIKTDGTIACWGSSGSPLTNGPAGQYTAIATSASHSCAITTGNAIACWGNNAFGQTDAPAGQYTAIATGVSHSCAITTGNTIACWGNNTHRQTNAPTGQYKAISAGQSHSCAITTGNAIACWGNNTHGQTNAPTGQYTAIATGASHSCAITTGNAIACWGAAPFNQADVPDGQFTAIATGQSHSCAISTDGTITCWALNAWGLVEQLVDQHTAVAAGAFHSCAISTGGTITCWGENTHGQTDAPSGQYTAVAAGSAHSCAIKTDRTIECWGNNEFGSTDAPDGQYTAIAATSSRSCAIKTDRTIECWGSGQIDAFDNQYTAIAAGAVHVCAINTDRTIECSGLPLFGTTDAPDGQYIAIAAGIFHSCAINTHGTIDCWGFPSFGATDVPDGRYTAVAAGSAHSCAIKTDGTIACWGNNEYGQTDAPGGQYTAVAAGSPHSCAIKTDGTIACWGAGSNGSHPATSPSRGIFSFVTVESGQTTTGIDAQIPTAETSDETTSDEDGDDDETVSEEDDAAARCFAVHQFGAQPVDVAKSADRQTVLAQLSWGFHESIGCYLTLDEAALQTLRAAPAPLGFPAGDPDAAQQCSAVHKFGAQPVDVAKSADRQTVLAQVRWGFHESIGCYLALDEAATAALRAAHT